jgi:hypothetical protein
MAYAAIMYRVIPGNEDAIAEIFANFKRADSPFVVDEQGKRAGVLLGTGLFIKDDTMTRFIHYDGDIGLDDIARHMARQEGAHEAERELAPYLAQPRHTETAEGFLEHFRHSTMQCLSQLSIPPQFAAQLTEQR